MISVKPILPVIITFFAAYLLIYLLAPASYLRPYVLAFEAYDFITFLSGFSRILFLLLPGYELSIFLIWIILGVALGYLSKKYKMLFINSLILVLLFFIFSQLNILISSFSVSMLFTITQQNVIPVITGLFLTIIAGLVGVSISGGSLEETSKELSREKITKEKSNTDVSQVPKVEDVISTKVCPHCGSVISSTVTYCPYCGKKV